MFLDSNEKNEIHKSHFLVTSFHLKIKGRSGKAQIIFIDDEASIQIQGNFSLNEIIIRVQSRLRKSPIMLFSGDADIQMEVGYFIEKILAIIQ